ncbi:complement component C1q receptor [Alosa sapidissima]|uniref:complement component C1q receptor n=1 Tax=Alosa sapidissima TaxID=34773 RepID=UPI001C080F02|nr:complement component C1q receptor [Alosa sapidissima]
MLSLLLLCPIFVACKVHSPPTATVCTPKACFTWYSEGLSFHETADKCKDLGGDIATIRDQSELSEVEFVVSQLSEKDIKFWIGLRLPKSHCTLPILNLKGFKWISGAEDSQYSNWEKDPENTCTAERCVVVQRSSSLDLKWIDTSCKTKHFYLCRFYFKGTCPTLSVMGPSTVSYTVPFSASPLNQDSGFARWPHGTFAEILCDSGQFNDMICKENDGVFAWTSPGPFCNDRKTSCENVKRGCEHFCVAEEAGVHCGCNDGYQLGDDGISCILKNYCLSAPCKYNCLTNTSGFVCVCPDGFQLAADQISCVDIDECTVSPPCGEHICRNTNGSYTCQCREGFTSADGQCQDVDECTQSICHQGCLNSLGSFSCYCSAGFKSLDGGLSCVDIDECLDLKTNRCEDKCRNTVGSYMCSCRPNFKLAGNGISCIAEKSGVSSEHTQDPKVTQSPFQVPQVTADPVVTYSPTSTSKNPPNHSITHAPFGDLSNTSDTVYKAPVVNSWVLVCVLASVIPLIILIFLTVVIVICRCNRSKSHKKKPSPTADSYCWVSSGLGPMPEKIHDMT